MREPKILLVLVEKQESHLSQLNGTIKEHSLELERLKVTVKGKNGVCERVDMLENRHSKLSKYFWVVIGVIASGGAGTGIYNFLLSLN